jgi:fructokinase
VNQKRTIVALGEVLWDVFPDGPRFGGAPANFACHAAAFGADAAMVSCVGDDELGAGAVAALRERRVSTEHVERRLDYPTGTVQVALDDAGKPTFTIAEDVAWDHLRWAAALSPLAESADAVVFGTLGQRSAASRETIQRFLRATRPAALRIYDINIRPPFFSDEVILESLKLANMLKLNDDELPVVAAAAGLSGSDDAVMRQLVEKFELEAIALTRGAAGSLLLRGDQVSEQPGVAVEVVDTVGAGDSFTATLAIGLLRGMDLDTVNQTASRVAAYVCSQAGATPDMPADLIAAMTQA